MLLPIGRPETLRRLAKDALQDTRPRLPRRRGGRHARLERRVGQSSLKRARAPPWNTGGRRPHHPPPARPPSRRSWQSSPAHGSPPTSTPSWPCSPTTSSCRCRRCPSSTAAGTWSPASARVSSAPAAVRPRPDQGQRTARVRRVPAHAQRHQPRGRPLRAQPRKRPDLRPDPLREQRAPMVRTPTVAGPGV
jgi:hypothetical protein